MTSVGSLEDDDWRRLHERTFGYVARHDDASTDERISTNLDRSDDAGPGRQSHPVVNDRRLAAISHATLTPADRDVLTNGDSISDADVAPDGDARAVGKVRSPAENDAGCETGAESMLHDPVQDGSGEPKVAGLSPGPKAEEREEGEASMANHRPEDAPISNVRAEIVEIVVELPSKPIRLGHARTVHRSVVHGSGGRACSGYRVVRHSKVGDGLNATAIW